jgi:CO/xanthine dehydrogenase Mo-binding subunit
VGVTLCASNRTPASANTSIPPASSKRSLGSRHGVLRSNLEATYEYPFQAHATLEVMNCTAHVQAGSCDVWVPTQAPETAQQNVADALGLAPEAVRIHTTLSAEAMKRSKSRKPSASLCSSSGAGKTTWATASSIRRRCKIGSQEISRDRMARVLDS